MNSNNRQINFVKVVTERTEASDIFASLLWKGENCRQTVWHVYDWQSGRDFKTILTFIIEDKPCANCVHAFIQMNHQNKYNSKSHMYCVSSVMFLNISLTKPLNASSDITSFYTVKCIYHLFIITCRLCSWIESTRSVLICQYTGPAIAELIACFLSNS